LARHPLFIVSNCQAGYVETFYRWSGLGPCFRDFECWGNTGRTKAENLAMLIARNGLRRTLLVGDTPGDQAAARECGVPFVYVDYGSGVWHGADRTFPALGLGYEDLRPLNPKLIYCSMTAFGQDGPRGEQTAYDQLIQATSGMMATTGTPEVNPIKTGSPVIDYATGTMCAFAISAAL